MKKLFALVLLLVGLTSIHANDNDLLSTESQYVNSTESYLSQAEPQVDGHEYVDLGLSVKWATMNIGATAPEDYGYYFAWGETKGYTQSEGHKFDEKNYKWCNGTMYEATKYVIGSYIREKNDKKSILEPSDDAAYVSWGENWRMPTQKEQEELIKKCTWEWTTRNGVSGYQVISQKNGNSIFLPAAGYFQNDSLNEHCVSYWTSQLVKKPKLFLNAHVLRYNHNDDKHETYYNSSPRFLGLPVRAVCK